MADSLLPTDSWSYIKLYRYQSLFQLVKWFHTLGRYRDSKITYKSIYCFVSDREITNDIDASMTSNRILLKNDDRSAAFLDIDDQRFSVDPGVATAPLLRRLLNCKTNYEGTESCGWSSQSAGVRSRPYWPLNVLVVTNNRSSIESDYRIQGFSIPRVSRYRDSI